jgi:HEPN domain-containing protein
LSTSETEARRWLRYAREDLDVAVVAHERGLAPRVVRFHAQQAAEKALKAAIVASGARPIRTHVLDELRRLVPRDWAVTQIHADLARLSRAAVEERYPDVGGEPTSAEAATALHDAQAVVAAAEADLNREDSEPGAR